MTISLQPLNDGSAKILVNGAERLIIEADGTLRGVAVPPQFDADGSLAPTAFVQRALGNYSAELVVTGNTTLTAADVGKVIIGNSAAPITVTLPPANACRLASAFKFYNSAGGTMTVQRQGADVIDGSSGATAIPVLQLDSLELTTNGSATWRMIGGSAELPYSQLFGKSLAGNGWQRLPSGLIIQWGSANTGSGASIPVSFPIAFPNACRAVTTSQNTSSSQSVSVISVTTSGFSLVSSAANISGTYIAIGY